MGNFTDEGLLHFQIHFHTSGKCSGWYKPAAVCSAPQAHSVEEQVVQPTGPADPKTTTLAPRVINVDKPDGLSQSF